MGTPTSIGLGAWSEGLVVRDAPDVTRELVARLPEVEGRRSVWVTDLLDLRSAYWRTIAPVEPSPERRAVMDVGREMHVRVGHALAPAHLREVRVRREGIVGQIDLLDDRPTELKTTALATEPGADRSIRSSYIEQLAIYCALTGHAEGRLVLVDPKGGRPRSEVYDVRVRDSPGVWAESLARAELARASLAARSAKALPRCPWRGRGCEFEAAEVCDCTGAEPPARPFLGTFLDAPVPNRDAQEELERRLGAPAAPPPTFRRFRDLLYPRQACFERTQPAAPPAPGSPQTMPADDGLYRTLSDLLESGPPGEVTREVTDEGVPLESVGCFRGDPVLIKVSRAWNATPAAQLPSAQPQYFLDLAFRCAALDRASAWLLIGYTRAPAWPGRLQLCRVEFPDLSRLRSELSRRRGELERAVAGRTPYDLPACPTWMYAGCAYRAVCECGGIEPGSRSNR